MKYEDIKRVNKGIGTIPIHGKNYAQVPDRVQAFRSLEPEGSIKTEIVHMTENAVVIRAEIYNASGALLATGTAEEKANSSQINRTSYIENCETSAVGRALGFLGIGSEASIASAEEVNNAIYQQDNPPKPNIDDEIEKAQKAKISDMKVSSLKQRIEEDGIDTKELCKVYKVKKVEDFTESMFSNAMLHWEEVKKQCGAK